MGNSEMQNFELWQETALRPFLGEVRRKCGVVETLALPSLRDLPAIQIETLFVPPLLCTAPVHADDDPEQWPLGRTLFEELQQSKQIVVLGDPGGGKTTLSNWLAWRLTSGSSAPLPPVLQNKIPIPCILREMPIECFEQGFSVADLAEAVAVKLIGNDKAMELASIIKTWVSKGKYVLILDGIDEISVLRRKLIASWIKEAHRQDAVVLATSRIVGYEDYSVDSEFNSLEPVGNDLLPNTEKIRNSEFIKRLKNAYTHSIPTSITRDKEWAQLRYLMPFNKTQISDFARNWYSQRCVSEHEAEQKTSDLLASLAQSDVTQKLARTPNLLSLMAIVHRERAHLPDGKALLYDEIVNAYLNTIDSQRRIGGEISLSQFGWKEKKYWLAFIGFKLQESRDWTSSTAGILATQDQVIEWLEEAIQETKVSDYKSVAQEFLSWVARRSGLLLPRGENRYAFVHLSFQEYFCAYYLAGCIVKPAFVMDKLPAESLITKKRVAAWGQHPAWLETYIFLFESVSAEHGFDWTETLIEIVFMNMGGTLANLAARLVKNKHVKLPTEVRNFLANGCVPAVYGEADYRSIPESEVFRILLETGYAAYISGDSKNIDQVFKDASTTSKVRIIVARGGAYLSAEFLSRFVNLIALSTVECSVELSGLNQSTDLGYLRLRDADILDFNTVAHLKSLRSLELRRVDISDITPLAKLKELRVLEVAEAAVEDLSPLGNLRKISYLEISGLKSIDLNPLGSLKKLESLYISDLPAKSISFISNLRSLDSLQISEMSIDDFEPINYCKKLNSVDFSSMPFADLSPISNMSKLEAVFLSNIKNCELSPLETLKKLSFLLLEKMSIHGLSMLAQCKKLRNVHLKDLKINDVDSLVCLKKISALTICRVPEVNNVNFLSTFKNLRYLALKEVNASDISILKKMPTPFNLYLSEDHGFDIAPLKIRENFNITIETLESEDEEDNTK